MLCLSRSPGERLIFLLPDGRGITLEFQRLTGHETARFAIDAPPDVRVWREELLAVQPAGDGDGPRAE